MKTKLEILNKFRSPDNKVVLQAVEALLARGWLLSSHRSVELPVNLNQLSFCHRMVR